jgi:hypothetical protein
MKNIIKLFTLVLLLGFLVGCGGSGGGGGNSNDAPGAISGLGNTPGDVTGDVFEFPEGVSIEGSVGGVSGYNLNIIEQNQKSTETINDYYDEPNFLNIDMSREYDALIGSGGKYVLISFNLKNSSDVEKTVVFPAGLLLISTSGRSQNGLLIKKTSVTIPALTTYRVILAMYCANASRSSAKGHGYNNVFIVSNSSTLQGLFDLVANKKINIEEYEDSESSEYSTLVNNFTSIVWHITDSSYGLTDRDRSYIAGLPNSN